MANGKEAFYSDPDYLAFRRSLRRFRARRLSGFANSLLADI